MISLLLLALTTSAEQPAATPAAPDRPNTLSVQLASFLSHGVTLQYERQIVNHVSVATSIGHRWSGGGAFDTNETDFGAEGRYWFFAPAMIRPYFGFRLEYGLTEVSEGERSVGSSMSLSESLSAGVRLVVFHRFEFTPAIGTGLRHEIDPSGRLAAWTQVEWLRAGATVGVVF